MTLGESLEWKLLKTLQCLPNGGMQSPSNPPLLRYLVLSPNISLSYSHTPITPKCCSPLSFFLLFHTSESLNMLVFLHEFGRPSFCLERTSLQCSRRIWLFSFHPKVQFSHSVSYTTYLWHLSHYHASFFYFNKTFCIYL